MNKINNTSDGRTYAGQAQSERKAIRYQKFLDAGLELFGTVGFRQTTVRLICKQAKLTDRYFYESFTNLEDVLIAAYQQLIQDIQAKVLLTIQHHPAKDDVDLLIRDVLDVFFQTAECPKTARIIWLEVLGVSPRVDAVYNEGMQSFAKILSQITLSIYPNIKLNQDEIEMTSIGIIGGISQATMVWMLGNYQYDRQVMVNSMFNIIKGTSNLIVKHASDVD